MDRRGLLDGEGDDVTPLVMRESRDNSDVTTYDVVTSREGENDALRDVTVTYDVNDERRLPILPVKIRTAQTKALCECASEIDLVGLVSGEIKESAVCIKGVRGGISKAYRGVQLTITVMGREHWEHSAVIPAFIGISDILLEDLIEVRECKSKRTWLLVNHQTYAGICFCSGVLKSFQYVREIDFVCDSSCDCSGSVHMKKGEVDIPLSCNGASESIKGDHINANKESANSECMTNNTEFMVIAGLKSGCVLKVQLRESEAHTSATSNSNCCSAKREVSFVGDYRVWMGNYFKGVPEDESVAHTSAVGVVSFDMRVSESCMEALLNDAVFCDREDESVAHTSAVGDVSFGMCVSESCMEAWLNHPDGADLSDSIVSTSALGGYEPFCCEIFPVAINKVREVTIIHEDNLCFDTLEESEVTTCVEGDADSALLEGEVFDPGINEGFS